MAFLDAGVRESNRVKKRSEQIRKQHGDAAAERYLMNTLVENSAGGGSEAKMREAYAAAKAREAKADAKAAKRKAEPARVSELRREAAEHAKGSEPIDNYRAKRASEEADKLAKEMRKYGAADLVQLRARQLNAEADKAARKAAAAQARALKAESKRAEKAAAAVTKKAARKAERLHKLVIKAAMGGKLTSAQKRALWEGR